MGVMKRVELSNIKLEITSNPGIVKVVGYRGISYLLHMDDNLIGILIDWISKGNIINITNSRLNLNTGYLKWISIRLVDTSGAFPEFELHNREFVDGYELWGVDKG